MILLNGVGVGSYGPFFLEGGTMIFVVTGNSSNGSAGQAVSGVLADEFGNSIGSVTTNWNGPNPFAGGATVRTAAGNWTFIVAAGISSVNVTVRGVPV